MKNKKFLPLLVLSSLMLGACSGEIVAKPTDYNETLINGGASDIANNIKSIIYDAMLDNGTVSKDVLNEVLLQIAYSIYGTYEDMAAKVQTQDDTWLEAHTVYHDLKSDGTRTFDASHAQARLKATYNDIKDRIAVKMFDAIDGNYLRDGYFYEEDFVMSLVNNNANLVRGTATKYHNKYLVVPEIKKEEVFTYTWDTHDGSSLLPGLLTESIYVNYINEEIVPEIFRELLVESYLFEESYNTLGRSYARKVNIITISNRTNDLLGANHVMNAYVDNYINGSKEMNEKGDFEIINKAWRGLHVTADGTFDSDDQYVQASKLLATSGETFTSYVDAEGYTDGTTYNYFTGTSYAKTIEDFKKIKKDTKLTDSTIESAFTNSGVYTVKEGLNHKVNEVRKEDYTKDGWFIKNGGLTDLDTAVRNQLFNIGVSNAIDDKDYPDRFDAEGNYKIPENEERYIAKIHGRTFLKTTFSQNKDDDEKSKDILWFNKDSNSYTIVEVLEAVNASKLSKTSTKNYYNLDGNTVRMQEIAGTVAKEVAKNDSYKTLSTKYWLEKAAIEFHDEKIRDYFVETYPDIFDK